MHVRVLAFRDGRPVTPAGEDVSAHLRWCVSGMYILEVGRVRGVDQLIEDAYDIRHILALDPLRSDGRAALDRIYKSESGVFDAGQFKAQCGCKSGAMGAARSRYFHSCIGIAPDRVILLMAEGTPEQLARRLRRRGCSDAVILDQGGSAGLWASWL